MGNWQLKWLGKCPDEASFVRAEQREIIPREVDFLGPNTKVGRLERNTQTTVRLWPIEQGKLWALAQHRPPALKSMHLQSLMNGTECARQLQRARIPNSSAVSQSAYSLCQPQLLSLPASYKVTGSSPKKWSHLTHLHWEKWRDSCKRKFPNVKSTVFTFKMTEQNGIICNRAIKLDILNLIALSIFFATHSMVCFWFNILKRVWNKSHLMQ